MNVEVYCDESRQDILCSKKSTDEYLVIGSLWLQQEDRKAFKSAIHTLRDRHKIGGEFKWGKLSPSKNEFYLELLSWFFSLGNELRFRCIAVKKADLNLVQFQGNDAELGFYKFYYQLLHHWVDDFNHYKIFCDYKRDRVFDRLQTLKKCLQNSNLLAQIETTQWIRSEESVFVQAVDVFTGAVSAKFNRMLREGSPKENFIKELESRLGKSIDHTSRSEKKFNVFEIKLGGRW